MKNKESIARRIIKALELIGRHRVRRELLTMTTLNLEEFGFSRDLLDKGVEYWPWRSETAEVQPLHIHNSEDQGSQQSLLRVAWLFAALRLQKSALCTNLEPFALNRGWKLVAFFNFFLFFSHLHFRHTLCNQVKGESLLMVSPLMSYEYSSSYGWLIFPSFTGGAF